MNSPQTVLVTGGAGFIGSHLVAALVRRGDRVRVLDDLSMGFLSNLDEVRTDCQFVQGSVGDAALLKSLAADVDTIFHQAALASVPLSVENPLASHQACATGTLTVLDAARQAGVRRVILAASSAAYGNRPAPLKRTSDLPMALSPYAAAKLAAEHYCEAFFHTYGLETVSLRYFNVFGPRQDPDSPYSAVIPLFITRLLQGRAPIIYGDGGQSRDFVFVENVVRANLLAADAPGAPGRTFNVAGGSAVTVLHMLEQLQKLLGTSLVPEFAPARAGDVRESLADIAETRAVLGYEPLVSFEAGLEQSIEYYRSIAQRADR